MKFYNELEKEVYKTLKEEKAGYLCGDDINFNEGVEEAMHAVDKSYKDQSMELLKDGFTNASDLVADLAKAGFELEEIVKILKDSRNYNK